MLKFIFRLLFVWKFRRLRPDWRSVVVITAKDKKDCNDINEIIAALPERYVGKVPFIIIKEGCNIAEIRQLPDELLEKIRDAVWA